MEKLKKISNILGYVLGCSIECWRGPVSQQARHVLNQQWQGLNGIEIFLSETFIWKKYSLKNITIWEVGILSNTSFNLKLSIFSFKDIKNYWRFGRYILDCSIFSASWHLYHIPYKQGKQKHYHGHIQLCDYSKQKVRIPQPTALFDQHHIYDKGHNSRRRWLLCRWLQDRGCMVW